MSHSSFTQTFSGSRLSGVQVGQGEEVVQRQHNSLSNQKQNLAEAAAEIQKLLDQLSRQYPTNTASEKQIVVDKAANAIQKNPKLQSRIINAIQSGGTEALKSAINHPLVNILVATLEGWCEAQ